MDDAQEKPMGPGEAPNTRKFLSARQWFTLAMVILGTVATGVANVGKLFSDKRGFAIALVIGGAAVTGVINVGVREYYQPDVRYEEGTWYYAGGSGIVSLRIKNYGAADAENIKFTATFEETIKNASMNDPTVECRFDGRKDETDPRTITGRIERLVPNTTTLRRALLRP